jgi:hypothetical protein
MTIAEIKKRGTVLLECVSGSQAYGLAQMVSLNIARLNTSTLIWNHRLQ